MRRIFFVGLFVLGIIVGILGTVPESSDRYQGTVPPKNSSNPILRIDVFYVPEGKVIGLDLEEYVKGVVASEMPASFHLEALKAQAILARTYAVRKMRIFGGTPSRPDADLTSDPKQDQAWNPESVLKQRWGIVGWWLNWPKIVRAVEETQGLILTYNGVPAEAVYHSTCAGRTEAAKDVWGKDIPYLQSVPCDFCQHSPYYRPQQVTLFSTEVASALGHLGLTVPASKISEGAAFSVSAVSPTGRVKELLVQGNRVRGLEFRMALNLRSTAFTWSVRGDKVVFNVRGYGHGAGMCQYGADGMARQGKTYLDILSYYYPGTSVSYIFQE